MSMERSQAAQSRNWPPRSGRLPPRQLWQVPLFIIGVATLLATWGARPLWSEHHPQQLQRALLTARRALASGRTDVPLALQRAEQALLDPAASPAQIAEAHFLLGSAYARRAEQAAGELATMSWELARTHLDRAEKLGVAPADEPRLLYLLAKTYSRLRVEPERVVKYLQRALPAGAEDEAEGCSLLAQAYLRLDPPDLRAALETTEKQLALPSVNETALAAPRLLAGELYCRLDQFDEARKVLARIGPSAPPEILFEARFLRAKTLQQQGCWAEAAPLWEILRTDARAANVGLGRVLYALGLCYRRLDQQLQAQDAWDEARKQGGEEGQAAALGLAELRLRNGTIPAALEAFEAAVVGLAAPADYRNSLIELTEARGIFEAGCRWYLQNGNYEAALQLARLYERIALPGVGQELGGQAAEACAKTALEQARRAVNSPAARQHEEEAQKQFRHAGSAFAQAAALSRSPADKADWLWRSARNFLDAQEPAHALPVLEQFVALPAWYVRGTAFLALGNEVAAQADFRHCIKFPGIFAFRARYELAQYEIKHNNITEGEDILTQNLGLIEIADRPDREAHEKTLYALAHLLFQKRDQRMAYVKLEEALTRFPSNAGALATRFVLAQCSRQLADQAGQRILDAREEEERRHHRTQRQRFLEKAGNEYQRVAADCAALRTLRPLTADEEAMQRQADFAVAECRFDLGQFDEALKRYEELARQYAKQVEQLIALRHVWQCHGVKFQPEQGRKALLQIRDALKDMPAGAFDNSAEVRSRRWWEEWVREKNRPPA